MHRSALEALKTAMPAKSVKFEVRIGVRFEVTIGIWQRNSLKIKMNFSFKLNKLEI